MENYTFQERSPSKDPISLWLRRPFGETIVFNPRWYPSASYHVWPELHKHALGSTRVVHWSDMEERWKAIPNQNVFSLFPLIAFLLTTPNVPTPNSGYQVTSVLSSRLGRRNDWGANCGECFPHVPAELTLIWYHRRHSEKSWVPCMLYNPINTS